MTTAHLEAKRRYDARRKGQLHRALVERARARKRKAGLPKTGMCLYCKRTEVKTVHHHWSYADPLAVHEICYRCHRAAHPRKVFGGGVL